MQSWIKIGLQVCCAFVLCMVFLSTLYLVPILLFAMRLDYSSIFVWIYWVTGIAALISGFYLCKAISANSNTAELFSGRTVLFVFAPMLGALLIFSAEIAAFLGYGVADLLDGIEFLQQPTSVVRLAAFVLICSAALGARTTWSPKDR